jgi:hypothetical protein
MNSGFALLLALGIGVVAGSRSMTAPATVAWAAHLGWINVSGSHLAFMGSAWAVGIFTLGGSLKYHKCHQIKAPSRQALSTIEVEQQIQEHFNTEPALANTNLTVDADESSVVLRGAVEGDLQHDLALRIVQSYAGDRKPGTRSRPIKLAWRRELRPPSSISRIMPRSRQLLRMSNVSRLERLSTVMLPVWHSFPLSTATRRRAG